MNKNSKSRKIILMAIMLVLTILLGIIGGITYAKYYTKIDGTGNAEIARWSFKANDETKTIADIKLNNTYNENKLEKNTIAPGTKGSFDIVIDTTGADVAVDYEVKFDNEKNKPTNLEFTYEDTTSNTLKGLEDVLVGRIGVKEQRTKTLTIYWNWDFETGTNNSEISNNDVIDTNDAGKDYTFDITIIGTQVNPDDEN